MDLMDSAEPNCTKSTAESALPSRDIPNTDSADPKRAKDRKLIELPHVTKSRIEKALPMQDIPYTLMLDPRRQKDLREIVEPRCTKSITDMEDPSLVIP